ncbi:MAG: NAD(P)/FAD-dependent oxidoreductase [Pseudomonadales bacterium]
MNSIDRRTLLKLATAAALTGCGHIPSVASGPRVVVAGAGIIGASIAYHLSVAGAAVTVIDEVGPASHASRGTFAWINATWAKQPRHYHSFSQQGVANWHYLQKQLEIPVRWGGSLEWLGTKAEQQKLLGLIEEQKAWGEPAQMLAGPEIRELEPQLVFNSDLAAYSANDGAVDPVIATQKLLSAAQQFGARVEYPSKLTGVSTAGGRLVSVQTSTGTIKTDKLVLATGAASEVAKRFAGVDIPQRSTPGVIVVTRPMPRVINRIIAAPGAHMHQRDDGRLVLGEQSGAPDTQAHADRLANRPNEFPARIFAEQHADRMFAIAQQFVPAIKNAELEDAYIAWRPLPVDGHPVLGVSPVQQDTYLAIMHSGVSLAPIVGQLAAHELVQGDTVDTLSPYRPDRQFATVKRY